MDILIDSWMGVQSDKLISGKIMIRRKAHEKDRNKNLGDNHISNSNIQLCMIFMSLYVLYKVSMCVLEPKFIKHNKHLALD